MLVLAGVLVRAFARRRKRHDRSPVRVEQRPGGVVESGSNEGVAPVATTPESSAGELPTERAEPAHEAESEPTTLAHETIAPFARTLERSRRLWVAEQRVSAALDVLPEDVWLVEKHVLEDERRIPFVLVGPSGVFVVCATDGAWTIGDLHALTALADRLQRQLPGWAGEIQVVMCLAFGRTEIRSWVGGQAESRCRGWVLGIDDLTQWLTAFESGQGGLLRGDIRRLDQTAFPRWERSGTARLPKTPNYG